MSLRVWLPLTKDLRNQGLDDATVTNNGATFNSAGKLGGCYSFDGNDDFISLNGSTLYDIIKGGSAPFSITMWVYHADSTRAILFGDYSLSGAINFNIELNTSHSVRFYWAGSPDTSGGHTLATLNTWTHIAIIYDGTKINFYMNGELKDTYTGTLSVKTKTSGMYYIGRDSRTGTTAFNGKLNDFRIYDHALSQMEVKEISKGLVLHYPLNRGGWGQENLLLNSSIEKTGASNSAQWFRWDVANPMLATNHTYTLSFDAKMSNGTDVFYIGWANADSTQVTMQEGVKVTNEYQRYSFTGQTTKTNINSFVISNYKGYGRGNGNNTTGILSIKNIKLEEGSIATPWSPASSDALATTTGLNGTTEYDCSGFCNNGTRTGTFSWTSDTPKYSVSQYFNGSSYILTDSSTFSWFGFDKCTVAVWMKPTSTPSSWAGTFGIAHNNSASNKSFVIGNYGGTFTVQSANGNWVNIQSSTLPANEWHHCVATLDGTTIKMYFDGELVNTYTTSWGSTTVASDTRVQVGNDLPGSDEIYQGYYSDARIYATALSADDVKSLYQNSAYIDSSGNVYGAIHSEV